MNFFQGPDILKSNGAKHTHIPGDELEKRQDQRKLTELAGANVLPTRSVITEISKGKNDEDLASLPTIHAMRRKILRHRQNINDPKNPEKRTDFEIPEKYEKYLGEEIFLRVDTGVDDPDRILIFVTDQGLMDLKKYRNWSSDGTFRSAPKIFYQLLMIHVHINETQTAPRYKYFCLDFLHLQVILQMQFFILFFKCLAPASRLAGAND